jgi:hypothetical protein
MRGEGESIDYQHAGAKVGETTAKTHLITGRGEQIGPRAQSERRWLEPGKNAEIW